MLTFKQLEKKVEPYVLEYISNYCWKVEYGSALERDMENPDKYISKTVVKRVFDQEKYEREVRKYFIQYIEKESKEKKTKTKREKGKNISVKEFFELIFRDHFDFRKGDIDKKGRRIYLKSFAFNIDAETHMLDDKKVASNIKKMQDLAKKYQYFTPALFISHKFFTKETLALLGVIVLDFDLDKAKVVMSKDELRKFIKKSIDVEPNLIWDSKTKGNYQAAILIDSMAGTVKSVHLFEQVVKEMIHKLGEIADPACFNANHIFSIPKNDWRSRRFVRKYNELVHDIKEFSWLLNERDVRRRKENKVINFKEEMFMRDPAVAALMNGEVTHRDNAAFTLALVLRWLGRSEFECENYMQSEWYPLVNNSNFDHSFTRNELSKCIRNAYSGRYRNFKSTWIEFCTGIPCDFSGYFRWKHYENQGINIMDTAERIRAFLRKNGGTYTGNAEQMSKEVSVTKRSLERHISEMRKTGQLLYETKRGRNAFTTYKLIEQLDFDRELVEGVTSFKQEQEDLKELEVAMKKTV